jgi:hypothetical protein
MKKKRETTSRWRCASFPARCVFGFAFSSVWFGVFLASFFFLTALPLLLPLLMALCRRYCLSLLPA